MYETTTLLADIPLLQLNTSQSYTHYYHMTKQTPAMSLHLYKTHKHGG